MAAPGVARGGDVGAALVAGYVSFAAFVAARMVVAAAVLGALYLLYALIDAFFGEGLPPARTARVGCRRRWDCGRNGSN